MSYILSDLTTNRLYLCEDIVEMECILYDLLDTTEGRIEELIKEFCKKVARDEYFGDEGEYLGIDVDIL